MKYYKLIIWGLILYSILILVLVSKLEGFNGLKFLSFYMFFSAWFVAWWMGWLYPKIEDERIKKLKRSHIFLSVYFILLFPMAFGLNQKFAIIFFDVDQYANELKEAKATMISSNARQLNRFSGSALHTTMSLSDNPEYKFPIACNLLITEKCKYADMYKENFIIKYKDGLSYPFKYYYLIYEIKSDKFYKGIDYHIKIYKKNKVYVIYFIFFIMFPSLILTFLIPFIFYKRSKTLKELYK